MAVILRLEIDQNVHFTRSVSRNSLNGCIHNRMARRMMTRRMMLANLSIAGAMAASSCAAPLPPVRYRLTLVVNDGSKTLIGSGVIQVTYNNAGPLPQNVGPQVVVGEAVAVDIGARGVLFALLSADPTRPDSPPSPGFLVTRVFRDILPEGATAQSLQALSKRREPLDLPLDTLPMLVRFGDLADPKSVARVDPNDLAASFGPGVKLVRATIEITDDPVTTGIEKKLGWWFAQAKAPYDPPAFQYANASPRGFDTIGITQFVQGMDWRSK